MDNAVTVLAALGHQLRLDIWRLLAPEGPAGLAAGVIAERLAVPPSSLSFHLQQMVQAGLLSPRRFSRQIIYAVNDEVIEELCAFLSTTGQPIHLQAAALSARQPADIVDDG